MSGYNIADFKTKLEAANTAYIESFDAIGEVFPGTWSMFTEDLGGLTGKVLDIGFTEDLGEVRIQRAGESKSFDGLRPYNAQYDLEVIYTAHRLSRTDVQYDPSSRIARGLQRAAARAGDILDQRIWAILNANAKTGPDGVALFSAAHPNGPSGTQSNSTTDALSHTSYRAGKAAMRGFARENGEPYNMNPTHLFVHPDEEAIAKEVTGATKPLFVDANAAEATASVVTGVPIANVFAGDTVVVVTPRQTSGDWMLADLSKPGVRPWVLAVGERPRPIVPNTDDDHVVRHLDLYEYIVQGDIAHGPGHWQACYGKNS